MSTSEHVIDVQEDSFREVVLEASQRLPVLVDFWAAWCAPCQMLAPILAKLAAEYAGRLRVAKVNTDEQRALAAQFGIRSLPTVKLFRNGSVAGEFMGAQPERVIRALVEPHIARESDELRGEAAKHADNGDWTAATNTLRRALTEDPANERIHLDLANTLIEQCEVGEAEDVLKQLPANRQHDADVTRLRARAQFAGLAKDAPPAEALEKVVAEDPADCHARYQLSALKTLAGNYEGAMDELLEIMRRDRSFRDDAGRKGLLAVFELLGGSGPLVNRYRSLMSSALH